MKTRTAVSVAATALFFAIAVGLLITGPATARGFGPGRMGPVEGPGGAGMRPLIDFSEAIQVTVSGTVVTAAYFGQGLQIDTGTETVTVYGIGPVRYWDYLEADRPDVGDTVQVDAYEILLSDGSTRLIAIRVITDAGTVELRDGETGAPLWRRPGGPGFGRNPGCFPPPVAPAAD